MAWTSFKSVKVNPKRHAPVRPRFSLTSDVISFRRCPRQYGYFGNDGFVPALAVQMFYGTLVHQVLDRCHRHYSGLVDPKFRGKLPTDTDIDGYFAEVENALKAHGVRTGASNVRDRALQVLKTFNNVEGPVLYPRVFDTEYRLESDQAHYVLRGVVDVLSTGGSTDPADWEIWDYKGIRMPNLSDPNLQDYIWQMSLYAELVKRRTGKRPAKAVLYFLNELYVPVGDPPVTTRPKRAVYEVKFTDALIKQAVAEFDKTAQDIITCRRSASWIAPAKCPGVETCDACDIRWTCPTMKKQYKLDLPV